MAGRNLTGLEDDLQARLEAALAECALLRKENARLRALLGLPEPEPAQVFPESRCEASVTVTRESPSETKIALFRSLFRGREDVYPVRWETKRTGRSGYFPACANKWNRRICQMPRVKCGECRNRKFLPLTDDVIRDHLSGKHTIGLYTLHADETCWFLAVDFDKDSWQEDARAFLATCREMGVPAALERSRSGNGGHAWIFFDRPIEAAQPRRLGCAILTRTLDRRHEVGLDSYDRFFPSQDTLPRGGFGSLIALPLQRAPREQGNSVFMNEDFAPYPDQWAFLSTIRRMAAEAVDAIVWDAARAGRIIAVRGSLTHEEAEEDPWTLPPSRRQRPEPIDGPLPETVRVVLANMLYVEKDGLPSALLNRLKSLASFQNPEFYKAQAMRLPVFGKPRIITCAEEFPKHLALPRGCLDEVLELFQSHQVHAEMADERFVGRPIEVEFHGELPPLQQQAAEAILPHETGVLFAATAFGKTVVASWIIAARAVNTLVLVHRRQLMDQWRERLTDFLGLSPNEIGQIGGGKDKRTGRIDIGILQSLNRKGSVKDFVADYGQIIVDECHHIPAVSFEQVLRAAKARYVLGLTATPIRKDGHHPIILMQCGPIRFQVSARKQAALTPFEHVVIPRFTDFRMPLTDQEEPAFHEIYAALLADEDRNERILEDIRNALEEGRSPLVLTERIEHMKALSARLKEFVPNLVVLRGGMGARQREAVEEQLKAIPEGEKRVLIATGRYIGEGFDDARLDTLFLALPISWRGTVQQYAGRLHRIHENKREVRIYDYVDTRVPVLRRMYDRRMKGYASMGYRVQRDRMPS